jgi:hypothetical protein
VEETESGSPSDHSDEESDFQHEDLQLPPELLLQQAFTARSAVVNYDQMNVDAAKEKGSSLRALDHNGWKEVGEIEFPDLPLWFDHQVCPFILCILQHYVV